MSEPFTFEHWDTGEELPLPYPTRAAFLVARKIMRANDGGPLHIIVADGNVADSHIEFCEGQSPSLSERQLLAELRALTYEQREAAWHYASYAWLNEP